MGQDGQDETPLRRLRCAGDGCPDRRRLVPDEEPGWVRCLACGQRAAAAGLFRPYAALTGRWIVGATVMLSLGFTRGDGTQRAVLIAVGLAELAIVLWRIVYQTRTLRQLSKGRCGR
jgi:hypothetical protein